MLVTRIGNSVRAIPEEPRAMLLGVVYIAAGFVSLINVGICDSNPPIQRPVVTRQNYKQEPSTQDRSPNSDTNPSDSTGPIKDQRQEPREGADRSKQSAFFQNGCPMGITESITAIGTLIAAFFVGLTWIVYGEIRDHAMQIERAYVGFGTWLDEGTVKDGMKTLRMTLQLHNFGNTPASVKEIVLAYHVGTHLVIPPKPPTYEQRITTDTSRVFLVKGGDFLLRNKDFQISESDWDEANNEKGTVKLWLRGHVVYRDTFKRRHRAGYARAFVNGATTPIGELLPLKDFPAELLPFAAFENCNYDWEIDDKGNRKN